MAGAGNLTRVAGKERRAADQARQEPTRARARSIELQIRAPYTGAGLITIERDKVYAWQWFKATTTSTRADASACPPDLEGNGYVSVAFVRDLDSPEIFMSPLSYGVAPFSVEPRTAHASTSSSPTPRARQARRAAIASATSARPARQAVVFAVDEGILQVARLHDARSARLLLPEARAGGAHLADPRPDPARVPVAAGALRRRAATRARPLWRSNLNPFKRKRDKPVAYWSGIVDIGPEATRELTYTVPDSFNGTLRVMAVAVSPEAIGALEQEGARARRLRALAQRADLRRARATSSSQRRRREQRRGLRQGGRGDARALRPREHLEVLGRGERTLKIGEVREASATFRVQAQPQARARPRSRFAASSAASRAGSTVDLPACGRRLPYHDHRRLRLP